jgi:uncharacterized membrane protein YdbT with pleckstrin-like domain
MAGDSYLRGLLGTGEEILYVTRQHWLSLFANLLVNSLLVIAILAVLAVGSIPVWLIILALVSIVLVLVNMIIRIVKWSSNKFVVTNRRVIHVIGALNKSVSSTQLEDISDTRILQSVFGRMLDYADITVLTSSEAGRDRFPYLWHPQDFQRAVFDAEEALD